MDDETYRKYVEEELRIAVKNPLPQPEWGFRTCSKAYYGMKTDIHPTYHPEATVVCACGTSYRLGAIKEKMEVEICANCHPFYTGKEKLIDTAGRVDKFKKRLLKAETSFKKKRVGKTRK